MTYMPGNNQQPASLEDPEIITLGKKDQHILVETLLTYETPNEALLAAAKQYLETHKQ